MPSPEARPYHHGDLRRALVEAARRILESEGPTALSLRAVAREAGVSPAAPYHHFKDKSELLEEVARIMLLSIPLASVPEVSFEEQIIIRCVAARRTLLSHPNAAPLILRYFPRHLMLAAYDRAAAAHEGQSRKSGEPYVTHPVAVAKICAVLGLDDVTIAAALLHDAVEDTGATLIDVEKEFGEDVARIVDGVTKLDRTSQSRQGLALPLLDLVHAGEQALFQ